MIVYFSKSQLASIRLNSADRTVVGLAPDAARFFKFLLIIVEFSIAMVLFVRPSILPFICFIDGQNFLLACIFRHGGIAILLSSLCNLFLMTYAGYVLFFVRLKREERKQLI